LIQCTLRLTCFTLFQCININICIFTLLFDTQLEMWSAEVMLSAMYRGDNTIELLEVGHTSSQTFPYDEIGLQSWHKRPRVLYRIPDHILQVYVPLASTTFQKLSLHNKHESSATSNIHVMGEIGMGFALDESKIPCMSVEAAALYQLVQTKNEPIQTPHWVEPLKQSWSSQMSLFMIDVQTGWRGCFAEHRMWSSLIIHMKSEHTTANPAIKTPHALPSVRAWYSTHILNDFQQCVGADLAWNVAMKIAEMGFDGAPDLVLYHHNPPTIWFVEVKSATDKLKPHQLQMMQALSKLPNVTCQICCPKTALKRFASVMLDNENDTESD